MRDFEEKGYANAADETAKVIAAYHDIVKKKTKNHFNADYNNAFKRIDTAIQSLANQVFYDCDKKSLDYAYHSFEEFDHIGAIVTRQRAKKGVLYIFSLLKLVYFCNIVVAKWGVMFY